MATALAVFTATRRGTAAVPRAATAPMANATQEIIPRQGRLARRLVPTPSLPLSSQGQTAAGGKGHLAVAPARYGLAALAFRSTANANGASAKGVGHTGVCSSRHANSANSAIGVATMRRTIETLTKTC